MVIYEVHVGTATPEDTFAALVPQLNRLLDLGVTVLELMPVADFPGRWNWGYDGVDWYAPSRAYGQPDDLRRLVDEAHRRGMAVLMDVVYNHFGPDGNYLRQYSDDYFTDRYHTPWGDAINYDGPNNGWARRLAIDNACYWVHEYHMDGLRLDATHAIQDGFPRHLLQELSTAVRGSLPPERSVVLIAETHTNDVRYLRLESKGGYGTEGIWSDDFHHALQVLLTGERDGYYQDFSGSAEELARTINQGFLFEGQPSQFWRGRPRGTEARNEPAWGCVQSVENHDQSGNRAFGERFHHLMTSVQACAATALLLLPYTPMLFMGEEFAATSPFMYFTDHNEGLGRLVTEGRRREFAALVAFNDPIRREQIPDPQRALTFERSRLRLEERSTPAGAQSEALYRALLRLRASAAVLLRQDRSQLRATAMGEQAVAVELWHGGTRRLLLAYFGTGPLAAQLPPDSQTLSWQPVLGTQESRFGGDGASLVVANGHVSFAGAGAVLLAASHG